MKIQKYHYRDVEEPGWDFDQVEFERLNLLVGDSATGKTRLLNTIFNLGLFVASKEFKNGSWDITFEHLGITYTWNLETEKVEGEVVSGKVVRDYLWKHDGERLVPIVERNQHEFMFLGSELPKLSSQETSVSLLKAEEIIKPIYQAFEMVMRRRFFHDALSSILEIHAIPTRLIDRLERKKDMEVLFRADLNLSAKLFILQKYFNNTYKLIIEEYKKVFPFIREARITELSELRTNVKVAAHVPVFSLREKNSDNWIPVTELSSGMQKVLLIITDLLVLPDGGVYIIDEYENSLGINAIDFFPEFILTLEKNVQFIITSHHPYLINAVPPQNWYIFHRDGMHVSIKYGKELTERFGISKQQAFIQLINDPFFIEGIK